MESLEDLTNLAKIEVCIFYSFLVLAVVIFLTILYFYVVHKKRMLEERENQIQETFIPYVSNQIPNLINSGASFDSPTQYGQTDLNPYQKNIDTTEPLLFDRLISENCSYAGGC